VADAEYEAEFYDAVKPLVDRGQIQFMGNMGVERFDLIRTAKLGLTNPTGATETFCISNFELMAMGVPVVGGFHRGMTETLYPDRRLTLRHVREIAPKLNALLDQPGELRNLRPIVRSFVEERSDLQSVAQAWSDVFAQAPIPRYKLSKPRMIDYKLPIFLTSKVVPGFRFCQLSAGLNLIRKARKAILR
jgi:glycosyltransferase involved in cell wall biosynthesis